MWRNKKFIIIAVLTSLVIVTTIGGVIMVRADSTPTPTPSTTSLMARVAAILGIDQQKLQDAFTQAGKEQQADSLKTYLNDQVTQGKITQQQADDYLKWWQSKPNVPSARGFGGFPGGHEFRGMSKMPMWQGTPTPKATPQ